MTVDTENCATNSYTRNSTGGKQKLIPIFAVLTFHGNFFHIPYINFLNSMHFHACKKTRQAFRVYTVI